MTIPEPALPAATRPLALRRSFLTLMALQTPPLVHKRSFPTPWARTIRLLERSPFLATWLASTTQPLEIERSLTTPPSASTTLPLVILRSRATPRAAATQPLVTIHSLTASVA